MYQIQTCLCTLYIFDICTQCTLDSQPQGRRFIKIPGGGHIYQGNILGHDGIGGGGGGLWAPHFPPQPGPDCFRVMTQRGGGHKKEEKEKRRKVGRNLFFSMCQCIFVQSVFYVYVYNHMFMCLCLCGFVFVSMS